MQAEVSAFVGPVESDARSPVIAIFVPRAMQKWQQNRVDLVVVSDVVNISVDFVTQAQVQGELRVQTPVVLHVASQVIVVRVRNE